MAVGGVCGGTETAAEPAPTALRPLHVRDLGLIEYADGYRLQKATVERLKSDPAAPDVLFLVEHPAVYTYGRKSSAKGFFPPPGAAHFEIERGGDVTYHNPGQLVAYPILALRGEERDIHRFLRNLEEVLIGVLAEFGVAGERREGLTGVWVVGKMRKIASIGIAASSWVTFHGIALNVDNDLSGFGRINPCGLSSDVMTSLRQELGAGCPSMTQVKAAFVAQFLRRFHRSGPL